MYNLIYYNNAILKKKSKNIKQNKKIKNIIKYMINTMNLNNGIGISAPQIGININLFLYKNIYKNKYHIFINSNIIKYFGSIKNKIEGCLSIPNIKKKIKRYNSIIIEYRNLKWEKKKKIYSSNSSRIIQHEYDHIKGILFIDLLSNKNKKKIKNKLKKINIKYNKSM
ncbi:MAG: peptide deformylase [Candidatus Shikimatogenerans sp. AspAUS03]|uniref:Peptide deformylase n=1 Tax=Candidatus Shikimatogenerans sp. AspAUS03 TaxID=3158563 RepID=A0AAU7QST8_9FLAO